MRFQFTHPVRGATTYSAFILLERPKFQFTHPVRGATHWIAHSDNPRYVSIHAPRAGCDTSSLAIAWLGRCFNSRTPCGVRRYGINHIINDVLSVSIHAPRAGCDTSSLAIAWLGRCFNSRTPCGVRLTTGDITKRLARVSIHAPRVGCDCDAQRYALVED